AAGGAARAARVARRPPPDVARRRASAEGADLVSDPRSPAPAGTDAVSRPPRFAERLLRRTLPPGERGDTVLGDLIEEWQSRGGTRGASLSFWRQAVSVAIGYRGRRQRLHEPATAGERNARMSLDNLRQDVRYAIRSYLRAPSFTLTILITLALGIGASTAIFSMVNGILLRPLALPDPDALVYANEVNA